MVSPFLDYEFQTKEYLAEATKLSIATSDDLLMNNIPFDRILTAIRVYLGITPQRLRTKTDIDAEKYQYALSLIANYAKEEIPYCALQINEQEANIANIKSDSHAKSKVEEIFKTWFVELSSEYRCNQYANLAFAESVQLGLKNFDDADIMLS